MATHRYILSAGHRNENRGGATREIDWTYDQCVLVAQEIRRRGGEAYIIQEHDGDWDKTFSHGRGLQNVARLCVDLADAVGGVDAYLSLHYEGALHRIRGVFGIYPDSVHGGVDVAANNPLDILLARAGSRGVNKRTGMPLRGDGTMSERRTHVGADLHARLGEFVGTLGFRHRTARVIYEFGNYEHPTDRQMLWDTGFRRGAAAGIVDGLEEVFGPFSSKPAPAPEPTTPFVKGVKARASDRLNVRVGTNTGYPIVHTLDVGETVDVIADDVGDTVRFEDGYTWVAVGGGWGTGWAASTWLEPIGTPTPPPTPTLDTFTTRYELPFRDDYGFNGPITATLPIGTKGELLRGPEERDGIGWYKARLADGREGWVPASILRTLDIVGSGDAVDVD